MLWRPALACLVLAALAPAVRAGHFQGLGDLPGYGFQSRAWDVSDDGSVVVGTSSSELAPMGEAFRWTRGTGMVGLGNLPCIDDEGASSYTRGTSGDGAVVVGEGWTDASGMGAWQAWRWTEAAGMVPVGGPVGGGVSTGAEDASLDGAVIVGALQSDAVGLGNQAWRWTEAGGIDFLGDLPGGGIHSHAYAVSADGMVVVGSGTDDVGKQAFRWTPLGGMEGLGDLAGGDVSSTAYAVSASGAVVVGRGRSAAGDEAFRWTRSEGMTGLGDLPGGLVRSYAHGVSADGSVVVGYSGATGGEKAFIWTSQHGMRCLQDVITEEYGLNAGGWTLERAQAVTPDGGVIVGWGKNPAGATEAWRVDLRAARLRLLAGLVNIVYHPNGFLQYDEQGMAANAIGCDAVAHLEDLELEAGDDFTTLIWDYDPVELAAKGIEESSLRLYWFDHDLQVPGATEALWYLGGTTAEGDCGAGTDMGNVVPNANLFGVGCCGINTAEDYVWANITHGSPYTLAGAPIPEPATLALLAAGGAGMAAAGTRKRRRG
jgi:probable HAF family extracellular repeat protein